MSVIEASSGTYRSRVDGTIVLSVEIEPMYRADALALFGQPGTPMALAALRSAKAEESKAPLGELARWAVLRCKEQEFQDFLGAADEEEAKQLLCNSCGITSRRELDTNAEAAALFHEHVREKFRVWALKGGRHEQ